MTSFTVTCNISIDNDKPRKVLECYELKKSKKEAIIDSYVCIKLLTIINDTRPLYLYNDIIIKKSKNDNMESWARALLPLTKEELEELQIKRENDENNEMGIEDARDTEIELVERKRINEEKKRLEEEAEAERKKGMFGGDDDDDDDDDEGEGEGDRVGEVADAEGDGNGNGNGDGDGDGDEDEEG